MKSCIVVTHCGATLQPFVAAIAIPGGGIALSPAAGAINEFLLEKIIPQNGPIAFINMTIGFTHHISPDIIGRSIK